MRLPLLLTALLPAALSAQAADTPRLIPIPREIRSSAPVPLRASITINPGAQETDRFAATDFAERLRARGLQATVTPAVRTNAFQVRILRRGTPDATAALERERLAFDSAMVAEGYALVATAEGATIVAATDAGAFYGMQTLAQLISGAGASTAIHPAVIRDWPAMRYRGIQDDISRGPVPTLEFQKRQVRTFAAHKLNIFSIYFEHTLQLNAHPLVAPPGGAMSQDDVRELVAYAANYHITILPQQQTFGHLHHALKYELYQPLAETPHGHVLAPDAPGSLEFTRASFAEIDSLFPSPFVHIGADETFELGKGRTKSRIDSLTIGPVYLDYLKDIVEAIRVPGKRYLFWGDIAMNHPDLVKVLPKDLIAVGWDYWSRSSFDRYLKPFRDAGMDTWVAPGVSNWNRVFPNNATALANIQGFVKEGQAGGARGMLNTTWDDDGDAIFDQVWYGVLFGAAASWQHGESSIPAFQSSFGLAFHGDTTGKIDAAHKQLAAAHSALMPTGTGDAGSYLFFVDPWSAEGIVETKRLRPVLATVRLQAESALVNIAQARRQAHLREPEALDALELGARRIDWLAMKFQIADEIAQGVFAFTAPGRTDVDWKELAELTGINGKLQDMRDGYVLTRELFERSWRHENRPYWLQNNLSRYDAQIITWVRRIDAMDQVRRRFAREKKLPTPADLGVDEALRRPIVP